MTRNPHVFALALGKLMKRGQIKVSAIAAALECEQKTVYRWLDASRKPDEVRLAATVDALRGLMEITERDVLTLHAAFHGQTVDGYCRDLGVKAAA